ncbi:MAG: GTPase Era [Candidatus Magasanikbacteria bacterium CG_4_10_14_0_2_um_filter_37_12]|uniref:GTPase Era n=1 Tax=Candidatus Magasanikbacteria bacterium CG_4_10_14_0_2_um_filter_37_12 TaxID=1974637 RepID=A0A2M7V915_9BACT|nr:MAG: GTPase Era [Candidatus Magasanikbacteria bacterium CG_4_10_14_0_2_um_filter_37_12]
MKSGFVVLVGRSNVGKSTLLNTLVGTKIAATSFRAQMTRNIIHGVLNHEDGQAVFIDTPGIFKDRRSPLTAKLTNRVKDALQDIDLIIYVVDPTREIGDEERAMYGMIRHLDIPKILVINKSDLPEEERKHQASYVAWGQDFEAVYPLSALKGSHVDPLKQKVISLLPEGGLMYENNQLTNLTNDFWIAELIREKTYSVLDKEVPYSLTVEVDNIKEKKDMFVIEARILTNQERYKKIIIGKGGQKIKEIGQMARRELEQSLNKKVFLKLEVDVDEHWVERV